MIGKIDRFFNAELMGGTAGSDSLRHHGHPSQDLIQLTSFAELNADEAIAREVASRGKNKVPKTRKSAQRAWIAAHSHSEARDFGQPSGDECRDTVAAQSQSPAYACTDRNHILERRAEFDADHVLADVKPQSGRREYALNIPRPRSCLLRRSQLLPARQLQLPWRRWGRRARRLAMKMSRPIPPTYLRHSVERCRFNTLGPAHNPSLRAKMGSQALQHASQVKAGNNDSAQYPRPAIASARSPETSTWSGNRKPAR